MTCNGGQKDKLIGWGMNSAKKLISYCEYATQSSLPIQRFSNREDSSVFNEARWEIYAWFSHDINAFITLAGAVIKVKSRLISAPDLISVAEQ